MAQSEKASRDLASEKYLSDHRLTCVIGRDMALPRLEHSAVLFLFMQLSKGVGGLTAGFPQLFQDAEYTCAGLLGSPGLTSFC